MANAMTQTTDRRLERDADAALKRDLREAMRGVGQDPYVGEVRVPGERFNRPLYRRRDGLYVAGQPTQ